MNTEAIRGKGAVEPAVQMIHTYVVGARSRIRGDATQCAVTPDPASTLRSWESNGNPDPSQNLVRLPKYRDREMVLAVGVVQSTV